LKRSCYLLLIGLLSACQVFTRPDTPATLRAQNAGFVVEATAIAATAQAEGTSVQETAVAAATTIARMDNINLQLRATARAIIPPTMPIVNSGSSGLAGTPSGDSMQFVEIGTSTSVSDSDGCANALQSQFPFDVQRIYATARAFNIRAGTLMGVEWRYQDQIAHEENFVVPVDDDNYCLWFNIDPVAATFSSGDWSVQLFANEEPIEPEVIFTIDAPPVEGG
jgi:hypothetical protein